MSENWNIELVFKAMCLIFCTNFAELMPNLRNEECFAVLSVC